MLSAAGSILVEQGPASEAPDVPVPGTRPMRLCLVSQEYPPETARGGIGSQTYLKAHGLAALGHRVHVISGSTDDRAHEYSDGPVRVIRIPGLEERLEIHTDAAWWVTWSTLVAEAVAKLHQRDPLAPLDLVDFPEWGCEGLVHLLNRTRWNSVPTVIHLHGPMVMFAHAIGWPEVDSEFYRLGSAMEGTCLRLADRVFSSSRCSAEWCARYHGLDASRVPVIHTGVDTRLFRPATERSEARRPTVVFVGNLTDNKGAAVLADAARAVAASFPDLRVKFVGKPDADYVGDLQAKARAVGRPDLFEFPGFVRREDLPAVLAGADLLAVPSVYEGGPGFVYLEAMACGLPVIGCSGSGAAEVVQDEVTGLLVPPDDRDALAAALRRLLGDPAGARAMGRAGRRYVEQEADSRDCIRRLEFFYAQVIAECAAKQAALAKADEAEEAAEVAAEAAAAGEVDRG